MLQDGGWEAGTTQRFARSGFEFSQVKRLGLTVFGVVIASVPGKTGTHSDLLESARSIAGATEAAFIHETFHHQRALFPALLPILGHPPQRQAQDFRGQIGMTFSLDEEQKPAVVNDESQTPRPLPRTPSHPLFPLLEMRGRATECQDRHPVPIHLGDIAQVASSDAGALEVVLGWSNWRRYFRAVL